MNTDPLFVFMIITHQPNFTKSPKWISNYKEYLECFPWIRIIAIFGGEEPTDEIKKTLPDYYQYIKVGDYYEDLPKKVIGGIKHIYQKWPTIKGIFKMDDDVEIINMPKFIENAINIIANNIQYTGFTLTTSNTNNSNFHIDKCKDEKLRSNTVLPINPNVTYCAGPLYFLGADSIKLLATSTEYTFNTIYEDNLIGYILNTYGKICPIHNLLYHDLMYFKTRRINNIFAIHNAYHNEIAMENYLIKNKLPYMPNFNKNPLSSEILIAENPTDNIDQIDNYEEQLMNTVDDPIELPEPAEPTSDPKRIKNYKPINNTYIMKHRLFFLFHKNNITNYITIHGGLCNNLFQISSAWHYQLAYGGNYIQCIRGNINKSQISDQIYDYYRNNLFPTNNPVPKKYQKPIFINTIRNCYNYIGQIYEPGKVIIHSDYFQNIKYVQKYNLDTVWRHILDINNTGTLFAKHGDVEWHKRDNFISVHIRMGDFLQIPVHNIDFSKEIRQLITDILAADTCKIIKFIFFSDDIELLSKNISEYINMNIDDYAGRYIIINEKDPINTLRLMASCRKGHILSNSTFSLWGAILNPNKDKRVYLPRKWLNSPDGQDVSSSFNDICNKTTFF